MRRCTACGLYLFEGDFHVKKRTLNNLYLRPECKKCERLRSKTDHLKDPRNRMVADARRRAKDKQLPFDICVDDVVLPNVCPVLGITLQIGTDNRDTSPSLDRLDPAKGYVKGNINVISYRANTLKNNATSEELLKVVKWMQANDGSCSISHDYSQP